MYEWDEDSLVKVFSSCVRDDIDSYLCGHWYEIMPLSSVDVDDDNNVIIKLWMEELSIEVISKIGKVTSHRYSEDIKVKYTHLNNTDLYLLPMDGFVDLEDSFPYKKSIKIEDKKLKSLVIKHLRDHVKYYFDTVVYERSHPMYHIYDNGDVIGHRG